MTVERKFTLIFVFLISSLGIGNLIHVVRAISQAEQNQKLTKQNEQLQSEIMYLKKLNSDCRPWAP